MPTLTVDYQSTIWERKEMEIDEDIYNEIMRKCKTNSITKSDLDNISNFDGEWETLYDTTTAIEPNYSHGGKATVEILDEEEITIWRNGTSPYDVCPTSTVSTSHRRIKS